MVHLFKDSTHTKLKRKWVVKISLKNVDFQFLQEEGSKPKEPSKDVESLPSPVMNKLYDKKLLDDSQSLMGFFHSEENNNPNVRGSGLE